MVSAGPRRCSLMREPSFLVAPARLVLDLPFSHPIACQRGALFALRTAIASMPPLNALLDAFGLFENEHPRVSQRYEIGAAPHLGLGMKGDRELWRAAVLHARIGKVLVRAAVGDVEHIAVPPQLESNSGAARRDRHGPQGVKKAKPRLRACQCSLQSNTEPKQRNSRHSSPPPRLPNEMSEFRDFEQTTLAQNE